MPINSSHEFSHEEIQTIEKHNLTVADVRDVLSRFSVNAEGAAELELDTAISIALSVKDGKELPLESFLQNEVSEEVAREGQSSEEEIVTMPETTELEGSVETEEKPME